MFKKKSRCCWGFLWRRSTATRANYERRRPGCPCIGSRRRLGGPGRFPSFFASAAESAAGLSRAAVPPFAASRVDGRGARHPARALARGALSRPFPGRGLRHAAGRRRLLLLDPHPIPPPGGGRGEPRTPRPTHPSSLPKTAVAGHRSQSALELGQHQAAGPRQVDLLRPLCNPRRLQPVCRRLDGGASGGQGTGPPVHRRKPVPSTRSSPASSPSTPTGVPHDLQARGLFARRSGRHQDPQPPARLRRQSLLGEPFQDLEVSTGVSRPLRLPTACPELLPGVLLLVQHRASSFRSRTADPRGGSQPPGRTGPRPPSAHARHRLSPHPERFVRKPPQPPALPTAVWINPPPKPESGPPDSEETVQ